MAITPQESEEIFEISLWLKGPNSSTTSREILAKLYGEIQQLVVKLSGGRTRILEVTENRDYSRDSCLVKVRLICLPDFDLGKSHQMQSATSTLSGNGKK